MYCQELFCILVMDDYLLAYKQIVIKAPTSRILDLITLRAPQS